MMKSLKFRNIHIELMIIVMVSLGFLTKCQPHGQNHITENSRLNVSSLNLAEYIQESKNSLFAITLIDGNCPLCTVELNKWNEYLAESESRCNVDYFFVINAYSKLDYQYLMSKVNFPHKTFYDSAYLFKDNNASHIENKGTALIDKKMRIVFSGSVLSTNDNLTHFENVVKENCKANHLYK